ncbi:leucine-rich repeat domain-containing protein [Hathewaya histolytica]|uniref:leucine-rich repeat domain-containing protein n=1 Tax=Hathewaya histolytica TaxID=1498 RepID=UPI003B681FE5
MRRKTTVIALLVSFFILLSLGQPKEVMAYVIDKNEIVTPEPEDVIQDSMLNWVIRCAKKKTPDYSYAKLTKEDLLNLPEIYYSEGDHYDLYDFNVFVKSIEGLQYATDTERVILPYNEISDLKPMANLTKVNKITMNCNKIEDLKPLSNLTNVRDIHLGDNKLTTIEPLAKMTKLESLNVELNNKISDISTVKNFPKLKYLNLGFNDIKDITPLKDLKNIDKALILGTNKVEDISALANMTKLRELDLSSNNISDISVLKNLRNLKILRLNNNSGINDIGPLTNLTQLDKNELWLTGTGIADKKDDLFKVIDVNKLINKFKANSITIDDKQKVTDARKAYDLLSPELKKYIPELRIVAAEDNIARLEKGELIKQYNELSEFDKQPLELGDMKTIEIKVVDENGQALKGIPFTLKETQYNITETLHSNENGVIKYRLNMWNNYAKYSISVSDKNKYTSDIDKITFKIDDTPRVVEINGQPITGSEKLKFVLTAKGEDIKPTVDKSKLQSVIKDAESKDANKYTKESYEQLVDTLAVTREVFKKMDATQDEVNISAKNLGEAIGKLVEKNTEQQIPNLKILSFKVLDNNGQPITGIKFNISNSYNKDVVTLNSDENGIVKYTIPDWMIYMKFKIELDDKAKYNSDIKEITFETGNEPKVIKINGQNVTGKEDLKFVLTTKDGEVKPGVDKSKVQIVEKRTEPEVGSEEKQEKKPETKMIYKDGAENKETNKEKITVLPKTGEKSPYINIILGSLLSSLGIILLLSKKRN